MATLAFAGIEAASDLAPDFELAPRDLERVVGASAVLLPVIYTGMAAIALMAVPVVSGPDGPHTALGGRFIEEPVLGVVMSYQPAWLSTVLQIGGGGGRAAGADLGGEHLDARAVAARLRAGDEPPGAELAREARHAVDAAHRDLVAAVIALGLALPADVRLLAGIYAFGATLAIAIAHLSVIRLRMTEPDRERPTGCRSTSGRRAPAAAAGDPRRAADRRCCGWRCSSSMPARDGWVAAGWCSGWSPTSSIAGSSSERR